MLIALFTCLPLFVLPREDDRIIEKHVVQFDLYLLSMFCPCQFPVVKVSSVSLLPHGKGNISWCPFQQDEREASVHCNLHVLTPISALAIEGSWEIMLFLLLSPNSLHNNKARSIFL